MPGLFERLLTILLNTEFDAVIHYAVGTAVGWAARAFSQ